MKSTRALLLQISLFIFWVATAEADVIWPAAYVADSHWRFWYVVVAGLLLEAGVFAWRMKVRCRKALLISTAANLFSATAGMYLLAGVMIFFFFGGYFTFVNKVTTVVLMFLGSVGLEALAVKWIWKYPVKKTLWILVLGNFLSYSVVAIDLFFFGGWERPTWAFLGNYRPPEYQWLLDNSEYRRAETKDCQCRVDYDPHRAKGDFDGDGKSDLAIVVVRKTDPSDFLILIFTSRLADGTKPIVYKNFMHKENLQGLGLKTEMREKRELLLFGSVDSGTTAVLSIPVEGP